MLTRTFVVDLSVAVLVGTAKQRLGIWKRHGAAEVSEGRSQFGRVDEAIAVNIEHLERSAHSLFGVA